MVVHGWHNCTKATADRFVGPGHRCGVRDRGLVVAGSEVLRPFPDRGWKLDIYSFRAGSTVAGSRNAGLASGPVYQFSGPSDPAGRANLLTRQ